MRPNEFGPTKSARAMRPNEFGPYEKRAMRPNEFGPTKSAVDANSFARGVPTNAMRWNEFGPTKSASCSKGHRKKWSMTPFSHATLHLPANVPNVLDKSPGYQAGWLFAQVVDAQGTRKPRLEAGHGHLGTRRVMRCESVRYGPA